MPWCRQKEAENHLGVTVDAILLAERVWRQQESGGRSGRKEGFGGEARTEKDSFKAGDISMLVQRQVTPKWADNLLRRHVGVGGVGGVGGFPPHGRTSGVGKRGRLSQVKST